MWLDGYQNCCSSHAVSEAILNMGKHPNPCALLSGVSLWNYCAAEYAQHVAWLAKRMRDAGMVAEAEVLLQQLYAAVQAVKVRLGLLLCLWHCSAPSLADFCLICCS